MKSTIVKKPFLRCQNKVDLKDADELIEASDLLANIRKLSQHLWDYDSDNVFNVMIYDMDYPSLIQQTVHILDLERLFEVTRGDMAKSNICWHSVVEGDDTATVNENLRMLMLFFENVVEPKLHLTVMD